MKLFYLFLSISILFSCTSDNGFPNTDNIEIDYNVHDYGQKLYEIDTTNIEESLARLDNDFPSFNRIYFTQILPLETSDEQEQFYLSIKKFINDKDVQALADTVHQVFTPFDPIRKDLDKAFKYLKYYFPDYSIPDIYTFISYYAYQCFIFDDGGQDGIGLGLDLFLGPGKDYKQLDPNNPAFSDYLTKFYTQDFIAKRVIEQIIEDKIGVASGSKLIDHIIHNGKKLYLMKKCLPYKPDAIIHEYTEEQMSWCHENETNIWTFFIDKQYLYQTDKTLVSRYTQAAPSSRNMPQESPGRTANFLGLKIVEAYMLKNPDTTIEQLIQMTDGTAFLQQAKYKPPRI